MVLIVQSQITFCAPDARKSVTIWRHAATNVAGDVCWHPQEYQYPFIS
jgi:hypothetical protein